MTPDVDFEAAECAKAIRALKSDAARAGKESDRG